MGLETCRAVVYSCAGMDHGSLCKTLLQSVYVSSSCRAHWLCRLGAQPSRGLIDVQPSHAETCAQMSFGKER